MQVSLRRETLVGLTLLYLEQMEGVGGSRSGAVAMAPAAAGDSTRMVSRVTLLYIVPFFLVREARAISMAVQEAAPAPGSAAAQEATEVSAAADRDY